ncbi:MAG TPA: hypothetical protein VKO18_10615 [Terriglobia bacterium]|nr:hypothetical protein [Terriglobia bacterium]
MSQTFEDYSRRLQTAANAHALETKAHSRLDHLQAVNFGRSLGRMESGRDAFWLRLRWLLLGAAVGVNLAAVYLQIFPSASGNLPHSGGR